MNSKNVKKKNGGANPHPPSPAYSAEDSGRGMYFPPTRTATTVSRSGHHPVLRGRMRSCPALGYPKLRTSPEGDSPSTRPAAPEITTASEDAVIRTPGVITPPKSVGRMKNPPTNRAMTSRATRPAHFPAQANSPFMAEVLVGQVVAVGVPVAVVSMAVLLFRYPTFRNEKSRWVLVTN